MIHKASAARRRCMKGPKTPLPRVAAESGSSGATDPLERQSYISCECHQATGRKRCSASPELEGKEGKENELRTGLDADVDVNSCSRVTGLEDKHEREEMDYEETGINFFPDDDSNQILPVEQFFGNLDTVQRLSTTSARVQRENRRRHYYAREDSDEEEAGFSMQPDDRGAS
ncbi:hypothetical protein INR49_022228 [Caranx melampygus]|nr:hypothetical protein INR49_022228 [Caranx melampygus]